VVFLGNDLEDVRTAASPEAGDGGAAPGSLSDWLFAANLALDEHRALRRGYVVQWARALAVRVVNKSRREPQVERVFR